MKATKKNIKQMRRHLSLAVEILEDTLFRIVRARVGPPGPPGPPGPSPRVDRSPPWMLSAAEVSAKAVKFASDQDLHLAAFDKVGAIFVCDHEDRVVQVESANAVAKWIVGAGSSVYRYTFFPLEKENVSTFVATYKKRFSIQC